MAEPLSVLRDRYAQPDAATQRFQALLDQMAQRDQLPDVGEPVIPSGPMVSAGAPWANKAADLASRYVLKQMEGAKNLVETPGAVMRPNPYPEGSEQWHSFENSRQQAMTDWAPQMAMAMVLPGRGAEAPGEVALGSGRKLFDYSNLGKVPDVPQFDLARYTPPRGVPQRITDLTNDPVVRDKMLEVIQQGKEMGGANWYNADPLREAFGKELGSGGDAAFKKYMDLVAATSPRSEVGANVRNASYYYGRAMRGEGMPEVGSPNPQPYGHLAQRLHQMNAERVAGEGWDPLNNPKPASFAQNLTGNQQPVTVDTHAFRLPAIIAQDPRFVETALQSGKGIPAENIQKLVNSGQLSIEDAAKRPAYWQTQPKANEYAAMEQYYQSLGKELGLTPAQTQASAWVGGGKLTGLASDESKPFLQFMEDRINKTAEARGEAPKQTLKNFIRGRAALLSLPPLAAAALSPDAPPR
jgi:hypothetical protein